MEEHNQRKGNLLDQMLAIPGIISIEIVRIRTDEILHRSLNLMNLLVDRLYNPTNNPIADKDRRQMIITLHSPVSVCLR